MLFALSAREKIIDIGIHVGKGWLKTSHIIENACRTVNSFCYLQIHKEITVIRKENDFKVPSTLKISLFCSLEFTDKCAGEGFRSGQRNSRSSYRFVVL